MWKMIHVSCAPVWFMRTEHTCSSNATSVNVCGTICLLTRSYSQILPGLIWLLRQGRSLGSPSLLRWYSLLPGTFG